MNDWVVVRLDEVADITSGGTPRKSEGRFWDGEIPWISGASMHALTATSSKRRVTEAAIGSGTRLALSGSSLVLVRGMSLLEEIRVSHVVRPVAFNQDVKALSPKLSIDPWFLTYALLSSRERLRKAVHQAGHGTGVLATERLSGLEIPLPPLVEQRRIAAVLGLLDDLIDRNERLGQDLTLLASAIGQRLLSQLEPGESRSIEEIAIITKGYSYKSAELVEGDGWLVGLKNVGRHGVFRPDGFKPLTAKVKSTHVVHNGDLVVAQTDLTQAREVIGRPVRVRRGRRKGVLVASLDLAVVRPREGVSGQFVQSVLESVEFRDHALGFCNGTTVLHMGSRAIPTFPLVLPGPEHMARFESLLPLRDAADEAFETAESLRRTRDELLPLLMSGAVRVRPEGVAA